MQSSFQNSLNFERQGKKVILIPFNFKTITAGSSVYCL